MVGETMTLVFQFDAIRRIRDPQAAIIDARRWVESIGVVSANLDTTRAWSSETTVRWNFRSQPMPSNFQHLSRQFQTERNVLIGTTTIRPRYLPESDWEYLCLTDAADAAGWAIEPSKTNAHSGWLDRLVRELRG